MPVRQKLREEARIFNNGCHIDSGEVVHRDEAGRSDAGDMDRNLAESNDQVRCITL